MKTRSFAVALVILTLLLFATLGSVRGEDEQVEEFKFRNSFNPDCQIYFEMPSVDQFLKRSSLSAIAKLLSLPQLKKLIDKGGSTIDPLKKFFLSISPKYKWGLAFAYYHNVGIAAIIHERDGKTKELWKDLLSIDSDAVSALTPVPGEKDTFILGNSIIKIDGDIIRIAPSLNALSYCNKDLEESVSDVINETGFVEAKENFFLYANLYTFRSDTFFEEGMERSIADALGISSIGKVYWSGTIVGGRFSDSVLFKPRQDGWKGLASAGLTKRKLSFSGKVTQGALLSCVLNVLPSEVWNFTKAQVSEEKRVKFQGLEDIYSQNAKKPFSEELNSAFSGNAEIALNIPERGIVPELFAAIDIPEAETAKIIFDMCSSEIGNLFPLISNSKGTQIYYRKPIGNTGLQPACTFFGNHILFGGTPVSVKKLVGRPVCDFPSQDSIFFTHSQKLKAKGMAMMIIDNKAFVKWFTSVLPMLQLMGIKLPVNLAQIPLPEDASAPFSVSIATLYSEDEKNLRLRWESDSPLLFGLASVWLAGRMAGRW